jgi:hypothetical protein
MKKLMLLVGLLFVAGIPLMAADFTGVFDVNFFVMDTPTDDDDNEPTEGYFNEICASLKVTQELGEGLTGVMKLAMVEGKSNGVDSTSEIGLEELYVKKVGAFDQEALGFKFGKMEVPNNLDYDAGITHSLSWLYEMDETWGLTASYDLGEGKGVVSLTLFEGMGGLDTTPGEDPKDEDTGLGGSLALQWDTGEDAFEVEGLRLVVAYAMRANDEDQEDAETGTNISIGGTYTLKEVGLKLGLEIDISTAFLNLADLLSDVDPAAPPIPSYYLPEGCMLIAVNADYTIPEQPITVGLSYEMLTLNEDDDLGMDSNTTTRLAVRGDYGIADNTKIRFEYASLSNDLDGLDDEFGGSTLAIGVLGKF